MDGELRSNPRAKTRVIEGQTSISKTSLTNPIAGEPSVRQNVDTTSCHAGTMSTANSALLQKTESQPNIVAKRPFEDHSARRLPAELDDAPAGQVTDAVVAISGQESQAWVSSAPTTTAQLATMSTRNGSRLRTVDCTSGRSLSASPDRAILGT
ncbi:hypothetical protein DOTSEDRAFT_71045 [Dothistroma septosporum NZE10]|uniref:Uncharacterized protein n=1 Tax=Dothistroma septosporum (strain NZE10 / CBS 128990) TaxID=675120 RepID=N1PS52_DOTSN|nr:hypothetical protein DOTSEDRAFT_71045 [Dothistroma septosporum NZE10]